tara:strand:+ start:264 stop:809 length:546 start_codon:yes stop_codon:yes gene_type:complete
MPVTANGREVSNNIDDLGSIVDPISLDTIKMGPGESLPLGTFVFNIDTLYRLFRDVIDVSRSGMPMETANWNEFLGHEVTQSVFNDGGHLRFIDINDPVVLEDLKRLYLSFGGGESMGRHSKYNTRQGERQDDVYNMHSDVIKPIVWGASLRKKRRSKKPKKKKPKKRPKKKKKQTKKKGK